MRASDLPESYNAVDILERNLRERSEKVALESAARSATFAELSAETNRVGNALRQIDLRPGETVAILAADSAEWVCAFFGTLKVGGVALGMNTLLTPSENVFMLSDSAARVLIADAALLEALRRAGDLRSTLPRLRHVISIGEAGAAADQSYADWIAGVDDVLEAHPTRRDDFATLNYSSGTTGEPKGILHAHKDLPLTAQLWGVDVLGLRESDRTFAAAKLFFTFGTGGNLIFPWYVGASVVLLAESPRVVDNVLATVARFAPTILYNAPTGYAMALALDDLSDRYDLSSLRLCVSAGEALPAPVWKAWKDRTGLDIIDGIGSTENYHIFLSNRPDDIRPGSSGKPMAGYELRLVDDDEQTIEESDRVGNLWVRGETAARGYLNRSEATRRAFRGDWLVTGDKYYRDADGYYWHAGRADDMLKVGGIWVSPMEVESALLAHPAVVECAVVGREDAAGLVKPAAFVVLKDGLEPSKEQSFELIAHCSETMAAYKRPRWVEFVSELPKTATGKTQRYRLRAAGEHVPERRRT